MCEVQSIFANVSSSYFRSANFSSIMHCHLVVIFLLGINLLEPSVESRTSEELRITLPNGSKLVGRALRSHDGRMIKAYMGIPYAQPPLGKLRFKVSWI